MRILLTGGSASGKSTYARELARSFPAPRYCIYTMRPDTEGSLSEAERQRVSQNIKDFTEIVRCTDLGTQALPQRGTVLLDCMCNLTANEMFDEQGNVRNVTDSILADIATLETKCDTLIVITNEIGSDYQRYYDSTPEYIHTLGRLNAALARRFDCVMELVCGIPVPLKGALPANMTKTGDCDMTLVIGGAASGKRAYVESMGYAREDMSAFLADDKPVLLDLQDIAASDREDLSALADKLLAKEVVVCNEVGSGVVPLDPAEHDARVRTGKLCILLAQRAKKVVRLSCGIPMTLKDESDQ